MARRFFKRLMPCREKLAKDKLFKGRFARFLSQPNYWHLNRDSTARGIAAGAFWAFIPIPGQTIFATLTAIRMKGNIGLAIAFTWLSNPLTMIPCIYAAYTLGRLALVRPAKENFLQDLINAFSLPWREMMQWFWSNFDFVLPFLVGSVLLSALAGGLFYFLSKGLWRGLLVLKIRRRKAARFRVLAPSVG